MLCCARLGMGLACSETSIQSIGSTQSTLTKGVGTDVLPDGFRGRTACGGETMAKGRGKLRRYPRTNDRKRKTKASEKDGVES